MAHAAIDRLHRAVDNVGPVACGTFWILVSHVEVEVAVRTTRCTLIQTDRQIGLANPKTAAIEYMLDEHWFAMTRIVDPFETLWFN